MDNNNNKKQRFPKFITLIKRDFMFKNSEIAAYTGSLVAFTSGLSLSDWGAVFGILFGLFTFLVNWYYKKKQFLLHKHKLEIEEQYHHKHCVSEDHDYE